MEDGPIACDPPIFISPKENSSPINISKDNSPKNLLLVKQEVPSLGDSCGNDYEYLERRLREFGASKPHMPFPAIPPSTPSSSNNGLISLARATESCGACKLNKCVVCERGVPESFHLQKPVSWYVPLIYELFLSCFPLISYKISRVVYNGIF